MSGAEKTSPRAASTEEIAGFSGASPSSFREATCPLASWEGLGSTAFGRGLWRSAMVDRRQFFQRAAVGAAFFGLPLARAEQIFAQEVPALPSSKLLATDPDRFWAELR